MSNIIAASTARSTEVDTSTCFCFSFIRETVCISNTAFYPAPGQISLDRVLLNISLHKIRNVFCWHVVLSLQYFLSYLTIYYPMISTYTCTAIFVLLRLIFSVPNHECKWGWWSGDGARYDFQCRGRPTYLNKSRTRAYCACSRCRRGLFGNFFSRSSFPLSFSLSLGDGPI